MAITSFIPVVGSLIDKALAYIPDPLEKAKAQEQLLAYARHEMDGQLVANAEEAKHESVFVAGWRPAVGWICVLALAYNFIIRPFLVWYSEVFHPGLPIPPATDEILWELLFGMLGIGGLRTFEKLKGISRK